MSALGYVGTWVALVALATLSLLLSLAHVPTGGPTVALAIAAVKALVVLWFFMHLSEQGFSSRLVMIVVALFFVLLISLTGLDVATRHVMPRGPAPTPTNTWYKR